MMAESMSLRQLWWLVRKDLTREIRAPHAWSRSLVLGVILVLLLAAQIDPPAGHPTGVIGGLLWIAIFFAGTLALERSFAGEHDAGCWQALVLYPVSPATLFFAKLLVNLLLLLAIELVIIPLFIAVTDVALFARPGEMFCVLWLGTAGFAAVGTLLGALTAGLPNRGGLLPILLLPVVAPVLLSAAEATRIVIARDGDPLWGWWVQLLAAFAVVFTVVGALVFDIVMED
jgi:heme exporter protein B